MFIERIQLLFDYCLFSYYMVDYAFKFRETHLILKLFYYTICGNLTSNLASYLDLKTTKGKNI
jgi:hypothetical protein